MSNLVQDRSLAAGGRSHCRADRGAVLDDAVECGTQSRVAARENLDVGRAPLRQFSALTQTFATGARAIFGADDILAKHRLAHGALFMSPESFAKKPFEDFPGTAFR